MRKGLRSDKIWANPLLFREPFRRIPFYLDVYALMRSQYWSREELKKLGVERFAETVKRASHIPFWRERFAKAGIDLDNFHESDITRIPVILKKDFTGVDVAEYTDPDLLTKSRKFYTSGSTGSPFAVYRDQAFELRASAVSERLFRSISDDKNTPVIFAMRMPTIDANFGKYHSFPIGGYGGIRHKIRELGELASTFPNGAIVFALGSVLLEIARASRELRIVLPLRGCIATGEELRDSQRKEIEETLHVRVRISYGATEARQLGFECEHGRIHLNEDTVYFEVVDTSGTPLPAGEKGSLIITAFENHAMPFIRCRTGDIAVIRDTSCPCDRLLRTIEFHGRDVHLLRIGNGSTTSVMDLATVLDAQYKSIAQFQITRTGERSFTILLVPRANFKKEKAELELTEQLRARIHPNIQIEWKIVETIPEGPNGKALYFIDQYKNKK